MSEAPSMHRLRARRERIVELGETAVGVTDAGPDSAEALSADVPSIVLLHGFSGRRSGWETVIRAFERSCRIVAVDLPGHGDSRVAEDRALSMDEAANLLEETVAKLALESFTLVGYSLGGRLALHYALAFASRVQRLVLEGVRPGLARASEREQRRRADEELADFVEARGIEAFVERWCDIPLLASQRQLPAVLRSRLRAERLSQRPSGLAASLRGMGVGAQAWLEPRLSSIDVPVLLLSGGKDRRFTDTAQAMAALLPQAITEVVEGSGHNVHLERPAEFVRVLREFIGLPKTAQATSNVHE